MNKIRLKPLVPNTANFSKSPLPEVAKDFIKANAISVLLA